MTSLSVIQLKAIQAMIESIDVDDENDSKAALKLIRALLGPDKPEKQS